MRRKVMLKEVISVVKLSVSPIWCWPLPQDATKLKVLCVKLYHCLSIIMLIGLVAPLMYAAANHFDDYGILVDVLLFISSIWHAICNFIFHRINSHRIQNVTIDMVHFSSLMKPHEEIIIQRYIDKCIVFYSISMFSIYFFTFLAAAILPPATQQTFPTFAEYPFDVFYQPLKTIIFIQQSIVGVIVSGQLCTNIYMALLLWFTSAKFEILSEELEKVRNAYQLFECIKKHQKLLNYAMEVTIATRPFAFTTICCSTVSAIATFLLCITHQPIVTILRSFGLVLICLAEVYMYTWPAEYLMHMSNKIAQVAFNIIENNYFIGIWKCVQIIIMRSQKPIKIVIPCLMPALSLNYFTSYLSTILSYFTTLRVMMSDE